MEAPIIRGENFLVGPSLWSHYPGLLATFDQGTSSDKILLQATNQLVSLVPEIELNGVFKRYRTLPAALIALADLLSQTIGAYCGKSVILPGSAKPPRLFIASPRRQVARELVSGVNQILLSLPGRDFSVIEKVVTRLLASWETPAEAALLAQAAREQKIPVTWPDSDQNWLVLGQGIHRLIYHRGYLSSEVGLRDLADDKLASSRLLEKAGLPTTQPTVVLTAEQAVTQALVLGMPVVLKPNRGWAQVGVWTNLSSAESVRNAFQRAAEVAGPLGGPLLIERHREGTHLRATLVAGIFRAALTYEAPVVRGDGMQTAEALARQFHRLADEQLNARARGIFEAVLDHQDLTLDSIPGRGRSFLVGHANHGRSIDVTERVHPSLKRLLNRVGQLFGVPLLGVDMIVRDPSAAFDYKEDVIIEVNPAPAFAMHERPAVGMSRNFSGTILKHLFPTGNGAARVPVVAGPVGCGPQLEELAKALGRKGVHAAGYTRNIAWSGTPRDERGRGPLGFSLLPLDSMAEVLLLEIDEVLAGVIGLPVDRVDFLVGNSSTPTQVDRMLARLRHRRKQEWVSIGNVLKACRPVPRRNKEK